MRKSRVIPLMVFGSAIGGASLSHAQVLFNTEADFGGDQNVSPSLAGQSGWSGWGDRGEQFYPYLPRVQGSAATPVPASGYSTSNGEYLQFTTNSFSGSTVNGVGNYDNNNDVQENGYNGLVGPNPDPNFSGSAPVSYSGMTSPAGSMTILGYAGGYDSVTTSEMLEGGTTSGDNPFVTAITQSGTNQGILKIDFTAPGGGTTISNPSNYFLLGFLIYSNNAAFASGSVAPIGGPLGTGFTYTYPDTGNYGEAAGSWVVNNGSYWTGFIPYNLGSTSPYEYMQFGLILNSPSGAFNGNVTIGDIEALCNSTWTPTSGSSWSTAANWADGGIPQTAGDTANITTAAPGNNTITLDSPWTVGQLNLQNTSGSYIIAAGTGGTLTLDDGGDGNPNGGTITDLGGNHTISAPVVLNNPVDSVIVMNSGDHLTISGSISGSGGLTAGTGGNGTVTLTGTNTYAGATTVAGGLLVIGAKGALPANTALSITNPVTVVNQGTPAVTYQASTGKMQLAPGTGGETVSSLTIDNTATTTTLSLNNGTTTTSTVVTQAGGSLDITNNHLIINYGSNADPKASILGYLSTGSNGGVWNGPGITSSTAASNPNYGVGFADGADGVDSNLSSGQIEVAYVQYGDITLSGLVNAQDFSILSHNFGQVVTGGWEDGDFTYSGTVNAQDFHLLTQNFGQTESGEDLSMSASDWAAIDAFAAANDLSPDVPEPASVGALILVGAGLLARRRRQQQ